MVRVLLIRSTVMCGIPLIGTRAYSVECLIILNISNSVNMLFLLQWELL